MSYRSLVMLIVVLAVVAMGVRPAIDGDTWWHLRAGQWILDNGRVPTTDPFSHTMVGRPWAYPGWLAQIGMLGFYRLAGAAGLTLFTGIFAAIGLAFTWRLMEGPQIVRAAILLFAAAASAVYWSARPQVLSIALAGFTLWVLDRARRGSYRLVWALPPAMALWANLHGGFAIGLILIGLAVVADGVGWLRGRLPPPVGSARPEAHQTQSLIRLGLVFAASLAATAVNPHGPAILLYPFKTVLIPTLQAHILEWQPPDLQRLQFLPLFGMMAAYVVVLAVGRRRVTAFEALSGGVWGVMALIAVRNAPIFAMAAAPVIARHVAPGARGLLEEEPEGGGLSRRRRAHVLVGAALAAACLGWAAYQLGPERNSAHARELFPVDAVSFLRGSGAGGELFNDYNWGGYILWHLYPEYPTFVDGRTDVFSQQVFDDYIAFWTGADGWPEIVRRYRIGVALLPPSAGAVRALTEAGWLEAFRDGQSVVLVSPEVD